MDKQMGIKQNEQKGEDSSNTITGARTQSLLDIQCAVYI